MYVCMYVCMHVCMCMYVYIYIYIYVCMLCLEAEIEGAIEIDEGFGEVLLAFNARCLTRLEQMLCHTQVTYVSTRASV
jgi:hypothetical protein